MKMKCLKLLVIIFNQILQLESRTLPNTKIENRKFTSPFNYHNLEILEEKYQSIIENLPKQIDVARDAIIEDIVTENLLGYLVFIGFFLGFVLDVTGVLLMNYKSLSQAVKDTEYFVFFIALLFNSLGNGASHLSTVFNAGDPNLKCSSQDFIDVVHGNSQVWDLHHLSNLSEIHAAIVIERFQRDFNRRLECILLKKSKYKEAMVVFNSFRSLLKIVNLHKKLANTASTPEVNNDLEHFDNELEEVWREIIDLTEQVYDEVIRRRDHARKANLVMGFFNVIAAIGAHILYVNFEMPPRPVGYSNSPLTFESVIQDIFNWIFSEGVNSSFIRNLGEVLFPLAPFGWGYGCSMSYFLFLEPLDPGCGPQERKEIYEKYIQLRSIGDLLSRGVSIHALRYFLEDWRNEMLSGLHCFLNTEEGAKLSDTIDMYYRLALTRLKFTTD